MIRVRRNLNGRGSQVELGPENVDPFGGAIVVQPDVDIDLLDIFGPPDETRPLSTATGATEATSEEITPPPQPSDVAVPSRASGGEPATLVVINTYNHASKVPEILAAVLDGQPSRHVLVVDDSSQDGTAQVVTGLGPLWPGRLHILARAPEDGARSAYLDAFRWAADNGHYETVIQLDPANPIERGAISRLVSQGLDDGWAPAVARVEALRQEVRTFRASLIGRTGPGAAAEPSGLAEARYEPTEAPTRVADAPAHPPGGLGEDLRKPTLVVVAGFSQVRALRDTLHAVLEGEGTRHALVVSGRHLDPAAELVKSLMAEWPGRLHLIHSETRLGSGAAFLHAFRWALEWDRYGVVVQLDAGRSHDPGAISRLVDRLENADLCLGSRYVPGARPMDSSPGRRLLSQAGNACARTLLKVGAHDLTGSFKAWRTGLLARVLDDMEGYIYSGADRAHQPDSAFEVEMTLAALGHGAIVVEEPIAFSDLPVVTSRMTGETVAEGIRALWRLRHRRGA